MLQDDNTNNEFNIPIERKPQECLGEYPHMFHTLTLTHVSLCRYFDLLIDYILIESNRVKGFFLRKLGFARSFTEASAQIAYFQETRGTLRKSPNSFYGSIVLRQQNVDTNEKHLRRFVNRVPTQV